MSNENQFSPEEDSIKKKLNKEEKISERKEWMLYASKYFNGNAQDIFVYILLVLGLIGFLVGSFFGSLIIGIIFGVYFSEKVLLRVKEVKENFAQFGLAKAITLLASVLLIFLAIPSFFLGFLIVMLLKQWLNK